MADTPISVPAGRLELTDDSLKLLLHMDGADTSTTFTEESGRTVTANGNAQIDTAQAQFGSAACLLDGTGDFLSLPDSADFEPGSSNFTFECWIRPTLNNALKCVASKRVSTNANGYWAFYIDATGKLQLSCVASNGSTVVMTMTGTTTVTTNTWHHVAFSKSSTTWKMFLDGVEEGSTVETGTVGTAGTEVLRIGRDAANTARDFNGHVDETAIFFGRALYPSQFIPRTTAISYTRPTVAATTAAVNVYPPAGGVSFSGQAPEITRYVPVTEGAVGFSGATPTVEVEAAGSITVGSGSLAVTGGGVGVAVALPVTNGAISITGSAPSINVAYSLSVGSASSQFAGQEVLAVVPQFVSVPAGALTGIAFSPLPVEGVVRVVNAGAMTVTGQAGTAPIAWSMPTGTQLITGQLPTVYIGQYLPVGTGATTFTGQSFGCKTGFAVVAGSMAFTGHAPVDAQGVRIAAVGAGGLILTGHAPSIPLLSSPSYNVVNIEALF